MLSALLSVRASFALMYRVVPSIELASCDEFVALLQPHLPSYWHSLISASRVILYQWNLQGRALQFRRRRKAEEGMCARYTLTVDLTQLHQRFSFVAEDLPYVPRYNVAPTQQVLALINEEEVQPALLRWGLIPPWAKDPKIGKPG